ncbi:MAG TPA: hypothetical protein DEF78_12435 [Sphingobacterium sp.]|nr:hypothetical protein [Sphingobacterium sp.]
MLFWRFKTYFWFPVSLPMIIVCLTYFSLINYRTWISIPDVLIPSFFISSKYRFLIGNLEGQYVERLFCVFLFIQSELVRSELIA